MPMFVIDMLTWTYESWDGRYEYYGTMNDYQVTVKIHEDSVEVRVEFCIPLTFEEYMARGEEGAAEARRKGHFWNHWYYTRSDFEKRIEDGWPANRIASYEATITCNEVNLLPWVAKMVRKAHSE